MAARQYAQFLDASDPDQSDDDDFRIDAPPEVLRGSFRLYYIGREDSSYGSVRYLLSVQTIHDHMAVVVEPDGGGHSQIAVYVDGDPYAVLGPLTFSAGQELQLLFEGSTGKITCTGATTGDGTVDGSTWNVAGSELRLGGNVLGSDLARGYVSLPYAVPGAALPDPAPVDPGELDFSQPGNSGLLAFL
jgi:hypothetical protein